MRVGCRTSTVFTQPIPNTDEGVHCASYQRDVAGTCSTRSFVGMGNGVSEVWVGYIGVLGWEESYFREIDGFKDQLGCKYVASWSNSQDGVGGRTKVQVLPGKMALLSCHARLRTSF